MEKLYRLAKKFKAYQFDGDLKNSDGYYCPEWVQQAFERESCFLSVQSFTLTTSRTAV